MQPFRTSFRKAIVKEETASARGLELAIEGRAWKKIPTMCSIAQLHTSWWEGLIVSLEQ